MALPAVSGSTILCTMGMASGTLNSTTAVLVGGKPCATIADVAPMTNVTPCGSCRSMAYPPTAAATAAAWGTLTPQPCVPSPVGTWMCSPGAIIGGKPILLQDGKLTCAFGGSISIVNPGQSKVL